MTEKLRDTICEIAKGMGLGIEGIGRVYTGVTQGAAIGGISTEQLLVACQEVAANKLLLNNIGGWQKAEWRESVLVAQILRRCSE